MGLGSAEGKPSAGGAAPSPHYPIDNFTYLLYPDISGILLERHREFFPSLDPTAVEPPSAELRQDTLDGNNRL